MKNKNMDEKQIQNLEITSEQELPKIDEKQVKKMHRKKILGNVFLFSSLTIAFASIITIPLVLNRKGSTSRDKFVSDKLEDTIYNEVELTKDKKYKLFAMMVLKNVFPNEFELLQGDRGHIFDIFNRIKKI